MSVMDLDAVTKLVSGEGWGLLQSLPPYDESASLSLGEGLRLAGFDADLIAAALTQSRLRAKGHEKFGEFADGMLFTAEGLEQATRLEIAARHAQRFRGAGIEQVFDLGCGIGADAMAIAGLDLQVTAIDADEVTATLAGSSQAYPGCHRRTRQDPAGVQAGRHLAHVVHGAVHRPVAAGHRGQALAVVPARGDPGRHRGPVDIAGRRSAGVCDLVGPPGQPCRALGLGDRLAGTVLDSARVGWGRS